MGPSRGRTTDTVVDRLQQEAFAFDFFQAVRLLMRVYPERRPVASGAKPQDEVARFGSRVTLEFPASAIHEIEPGEPPRMSVQFMGFMGTQGALPLHYTEHMLARQEVGDTAMIAFLNLFNHRWISIFYKVWEKHRFPIALERGALEDGKRGRISEYLFDLIGMGTDGLRRRMSIADDTLLLYAGLLTQRPRSASALRGVLRDYFDIPVTIHEYVGSWYALEDYDLSRMNTDGLHNELDGGAIAGDEVWDQQSRFGIRLGPLSRERFRAFLPDGEGIHPLRELTRFFVGAAMAFDVQLVLQQDDVPECQLLGHEGPRLGWNSWLKLDEFRHDPDDAVFREAA